MRGRNRFWAHFVSILAGTLLVGCGGGRFGPASSQRGLLVPGGEHQITVSGGLARRSGPAGALTSEVGSLGYRYGLSDAWNLRLPFPAVSRGFAVDPDLSFSVELGLYGLGYGMSHSEPRDPRYRENEKERWDFAPGVTLDGRLELTPSSAIFGTTGLITRLSTDGTTDATGSLGTAYVRDLNAWLTMGLGVALVSHLRRPQAGWVGFGGTPSVSTNSPPLLAFHLTDGLDLAGRAWWLQRFERGRREQGASLGIDWYWD